MTDHSSLERRYRRWLALYPKSYRADREDEMVDVLMQGADPGQTRPRVREAADLATHGARRRVGLVNLDWERAHAKVMIPVRILVALWLCTISVIVVAAHDWHVWAGWLWLLLTVPGLLAHLWIIYRIRPNANRRG